MTPSPLLKRFMPKKNARELAARIIAQALEKHSFANVLLDKTLSQSDLESREKAFCTELVYGTLRYITPLEQSLRRAVNKPNVKFHKHILPHLLVAAYQLQHLTETIPAHAAVNAAVNSAKRIAPGLAGFANAVLRNLGSAPHLMLPKDCKDTQKIADAFGVPLFLAQAMSDNTGQLSVAAIAALNDRPKTWLRLYGTAQEIEGWKATIQESGYILTPHAFVEHCISIDKPGAIANLPGFAEGRFVVQDPASQIAALLVGAKPGQSIVDLCAAPGTKSILLANAVAPNGNVMAVDIHEKKAERILENAQRLQQKIEVRVGDGRTLASILPSPSPADAILLDAPCSSLGTTRRHPEVKLRVQFSDVEKVAVLQAELLESAASCLSSGGVLVYSVCSPMPQEGSQQIAAFLQKHPDFHLDPASNTLPFLPKDAIGPMGEVRLSPHLHDCDAFFAARLVKS